MFAMSPVVVHFPKTAAVSRCYSLLASTHLRLRHDGPISRAWTVTTGYHRRSSTSMRSFITVHSLATCHVVHHVSLLFQRQGGVVRFKSDDTRGESVVTPVDDRNPPPYNANQPAIDVFSNLFFYNSQVVADDAKQRREKVLQNMTVGEVYRKYIVDYPKGKQQGVTDLAEFISARPSSVKAFLDPEYEPVEATLERMNIINLSGTPEIKNYHDGSIQELPSLDNIWVENYQDADFNDPPKRSSPLCLVLGPSGSGKTCFALKYLRGKALVPPGRRIATVYLHPGEEDINFNPTNPLVAKELIDLIRQGCAEKSGKPMPEKLDMHVCLVFDEAGSTYTKEWFEDTAMLKNLCDKANELATSVTVVVVGTGITGRKLSSSTDAFVFRMKPWKADDLSKVLQKQEIHLRLTEHETVHTVAHAIFAHPKLGALATNARSAYFLVQAVARHSSGYSRVSWDLQLNEWTQALVTQVVDKYIASNAIKKLKRNERRRVAASVFLAVKKVKQHDPCIPTFEELDEHEIPVAEALIQYNLEQGVNKIQILPGEGFAFTITPALVVVLYAMASVYTTPLPGWRRQEELAALYAVRQSMLHHMERFVCSLNQGKNRRDCQTELDKSLERICLIRLQKPLQSNCKNVLVPMVDGQTIMMNGDKASIADIIGPNTLIQAKHTKSPYSEYDMWLYLELHKCDLVKDEESDTRVLRGLIAIWQHKIDLNSTRPLATESLQSKQVEHNPQVSKAFPENVLSLLPPRDLVRYAVIRGKSGNSITIGKRKANVDIPLPVLDGNIITFILCTNAKILKLDLGKSIDKVTITEDNVDDNMEIDVKALGAASSAAWNKFLEDRVRERVKIKFLFTGCGS